MDNSVHTTDECRHMASACNYGNRWCNCIISGWSKSWQRIQEVTIQLVGENQDILLALNNWDNQFKGLIDNVKVYSTQLTASQVQNSYNQMLVENAVTDFTLNETEQLKRDITLPVETETGVQISWETSDASVITDAGVITRGEDDGKAVLTASFTSGNVTMTKEFNITVAALNVKLCEITFEDTDNRLVQVMLLQQHRHHIV